MWPLHILSVLLTCFKLCKFINVITLYLPIYVAMETRHGGSGIGIILVIGIVLCSIHVSHAHSALSSRVKRSYASLLIPAHCR